MKCTLLALAVLGLLTAACSNERKIDEMNKGESVAGADTTGTASTMADTTMLAPTDTAGQ